MSNKPIQSPSYPALSLEASVKHVAKIEGTYRTSSADRGDAAKLIGYSGLSGPANKTLASIASYGLVERAGKGMMRVTPLAISILHPKSDDEKRAALMEAALTPPLFREIREQFPDLVIPPEAGVITHLNRAGFNPNAVPKAAKAFLETARFVQELEDADSYRDHSPEENHLSDDEIAEVSVGDHIQWESGGVLQFKNAMRVRWVSDDGSHVAVEGSNAGIPVDEVIIELAPETDTPPPDTSATKEHDDGETEKMGLRKAVFPVSEGDVTFIFPAKMTLEGLEELEAYLEIFLKKEKRKVEGL